MTETVKIDQKLDCSGLVCPLPIIRTKQAMDKLTVGQVLEMTATDPGSVPDMEAWSKRTGQVLLSHRPEDGKFIFLVRKDH